jgi:hypothetical protein
MAAPHAAALAAVGVLGALLAAGAPLSRFADFYSDTSVDEYNRIYGTDSSLRVCTGWSVIAANPRARRNPRVDARFCRLGHPRSRSSKPRGDLCYALALQVLTASWAVSKSRGQSFIWRDWRSRRKRKSRDRQFAGHSLRPTIWRQSIPRLRAAMHDDNVWRRAPIRASSRRLHKLQRGDVRIG